jgi:tetratricopeptide (TPR) repeat protein
VRRLPSSPNWVTNLTRHGSLETEVAESCDKAFGRYLRTLRERRRLTLDDVSSLSQTFPESIGKGYLSRCENGYQKPAFSKVIALSRIYEVPADVLVERMELDLELDRVGGPETAGLSFSDLTKAGRDAIQRGYRWNAYGYLRDAIVRSSIDPVRDSFTDRPEQIACAFMSCGTAARALGRHRFAIYEFHELESQDLGESKILPLLFERLSTCYLDLKDVNRASEYADRAVAVGRSVRQNEHFGYALYARARVALLQRKYQTATSLFQESYEAHRLADRKVDCALALNSLSQCYFEMKRFGAAQRSARAALGIAKEIGLRRAQALSLIMLGELDEVNRRTDRAIKAWREAAEIAKALDDKELRFKSEFLLFRRAEKDRDRPVARAIQRRLMKLVPWVPAETDEVCAFKAAVAAKSTEQ